jgi:adenylate kinase family enzyme
MFLKELGLNLAKAKKISVVGNSGSGKSTLSRLLGKKLGLEVFTVDKVFWQPGWKLRPHEEYKIIHDAWLNSDSWIIDGVGYWEEMQKRLIQSDVVIFLDISEESCVERAENRIEAEKYTPNQDVAVGCIYGEVRNRQMEVISNFHESLRPKLISFLSGLESGKVVTVCRYEELDIENKT